MQLEDKPGNKLPFFKKMETIHLLKNQHSLVLKMGTGALKSKHIRWHPSSAFHVWFPFPLRQAMSVF